MTVPVGKLEHLYFSKGGVPATTDGVLTFLRLMDIAPNLTEVNKVVDDHCSRYKSSAGINKSVLPYEVIQGLAQLCRDQDVKKVRLGNDQHYFHDAWFAAGGNEDFSGTVKVAHIVGVLQEIGMPETCLEELKSTELGNTRGGGNAEVSYRSFINSIAIDDELISHVSSTELASGDANLVEAARRKMEKEMGTGDAAMAAWPMIRALTVFKSSLQRILAKKRGISSSPHYKGQNSVGKKGKASFSGAKEHDGGGEESAGKMRVKERRQSSVGMMIKAPSTFGMGEPQTAAVTNSSGSNLGGSVSGGTTGNAMASTTTAGGGTGGGMVRSHQAQAALLGFSARPRVLDASKLSPLTNLDEAYDTILKKQAQEEQQQRQERKRGRISALGRSHPHSQGLDLVKTYATNPVEAPSILVKAKFFRDRAKLSPAERRKVKQLDFPSSPSSPLSLKSSSTPGAAGRSYSTPLVPSASSPSGSLNTTSRSSQYHRLLPPLQGGSVQHNSSSSKNNHNNHSNSSSYFISSPAAAAAAIAKQRKKQEAPPRLSPGDLDFYSVENHGTTTYTAPVTEDKYRGGKGRKNTRGGFVGTSSPAPEEATETKKVVVKRWTTVCIQVVPTRKKKVKSPEDAAGEHHETIPGEEECEERM